MDASQPVPALTERPARGWPGWGMDALAALLTAAGISALRMPRKARPMREWMRLTASSMVSTTATAQTQNMASVVPSGMQVTPDRWTAITWAGSGPAAVSTVTSSPTAAFRPRTPMPSPTSCHAPSDRRSFPAHRNQRCQRRHHQAQSPVQSKLGGILGRPHGNARPPS